MTSRRGKTKKFRVKPKYKRLVISTRYNKSPYTARVMLRSPLKGSTMLVACRQLQRETHLLCTTKHISSILRRTSTDKLKAFSWKPILSEAKLRMPLVYSFLKAMLMKRGSMSIQARIGIAIAVLLMNRNQCLNQVQTIVSIILYAGHCSKQVRYRKYNI